MIYNHGRFRLSKLINFTKIFLQKQSNINLFEASNIRLVNNEENQFICSFPGEIWKQEKDFQTLAGTLNVAFAL